MRYALIGRGDPWLYTVGRLVLVPPVRLYGRFTCVGAANLPESGPAIVVANHHSVFDPILLGVSLRGRCTSWPMSCSSDAASWGPSSRGWVPFR